MMLPARITSKFAVADTGCWEWTAAISPFGYGKTYDSGRKRMGQAHRVVYELAVGPIPAGLHLDHLCRNRRCVNPEHLEPVTQLVNQRRGFGAPAINGRKTFCIHGHALAGENLYRRPDGCRGCRACKKIAKDRFDNKRRIAALEELIARQDDAGAGPAEAQS